jgi:hypothetical protein
MKQHDAGNQRREAKPKRWQVVGAPVVKWPDAGNQRREAKPKRWQVVGVGPHDN